MYLPTYEHHECKDNSAEEGNSGDSSIQVTHFSPYSVTLINGCIMLDSTTGSFYIFANLLTKLGVKPIRKERRAIEQLYGILKKTVEILKVRLPSILFEEFSKEMECKNAAKEILTYLPNPMISELKKKFSYYNSPIDDEGLTIQPIHIIRSFRL